MNEMIKVMGVAFVTVLSVSIVRLTKPELAFAVTVTGVLVILLYIMDMLQASLSVFTKIADMTGVENGLLKLLLKIVGVGYITEFGAGILIDFGSPSVADKVCLCGKLVIVTLSFPIIESLLTLIRGFLGLI